MGQYISRTEGKWYDGETEGLFGGAGVTENEVTVAGKCAVGWAFGKCVNGTGGGGGAAVTGKGIFSVYLFDEFDTVFVVWQLNQKK